MIKFFSPGAAQWLEQEEYRVVRTDSVVSASVQYVQVTVDRPINPEVTTDKIIPGRISKYIVQKRVPDETNLILRYAPTIPVTQDGLVYPQYLDPVVKANAGNVLQSLKANNLI